MPKRIPTSAKSHLSRETFVAQVVSCHGRHHFVRDESGKLYEAHRRGKKGDVVVGDTVVCSAAVDNTVAIESIKERTSLLFRQDEWRTKTLAANIDTLVIVYASRPRFNPWFVWKALLAAHAARVHPVIIRNKTDLAEGAEEAARFLNSLELLVYETHEMYSQPISAEALDQLYMIVNNHRSLLVGQSGMGKSTILNLLVQNANAKTQEYSQALNLGRQTTTVTTLYDLDRSYGFVIDSPGFQEFGLAHLELNEVIAAMPDIAQYVGGCRFANCKHLKEPACSVKRALQDGLIAQDRYDFYCAIAQTLENKSTY